MTGVEPTEDDHELIPVRLRVDERFHGWRLDSFIKARIPRLSRTRIQQMIRAQGQLGGAIERPARRVYLGEELTLWRPKPVEPDVPRSFDILFSDEDVLAICKPAGLPVHATARFHQNTLTTVLRERFPGAVPIPAHRLDRETSGLMLLGRTPEAGAALKAAFRLRRVHKRYLCIVHGQPPSEGIITLPLGLDPDGPIRIRMAVVPGGAEAVTRFRTLEHRGRFSLVEALPETGRQHQIRAHLLALGHPVVGDKLYGPDPSCFLEFIETGYTPSLARLLLLPRQALHAAEVSFPHPRTGCIQNLVCPLPSDLEDFWRTCGEFPDIANKTA